MRLHGCPPALQARGLGSLGAKLVRPHYCWDGKTQVINDSDCPPQPVQAPIQPTVASTPAAPQPLAPVVTVEPVPTTPQPTVEQPTVEPRAELKPQVAAMSLATADSEFVTLPASSSVSTVPVGADDATTTAEIPVESPKFNWIAAIAIAAALYSLG
jgi:hypothetical protein